MENCAQSAQTADECSHSPRDARIRIHRKKGTPMRRLLLAILTLVIAIPAWGMDRQNNADYHARRTALANLMDGGSLLLFAPTEAEGPNNLYGFRQEDDFYYLTGWSEPGAAVLINSNPYSEVLFLPAHNATQEKWTGPKLGPEDQEASRATGFDKVKSLDQIH